MIDTDAPAHGSIRAKPEGSCEIDMALEMLELALTQLRVAQRSLVLEAHKCGWHWLSQIVTLEGTYRDTKGLGAYKVTVLEQWKCVLSEGNKPNQKWVGLLQSLREDWADGAHSVEGVPPVELP